MAIKIMTDSTSDLAKDIARQLGITVIPLNVHFGTDTYKDGEEMQANEVYGRLLTNTTLPKTSAPSPGLFRGSCKWLMDDGSDIASIHISHKLSGTYPKQAVVMARLGPVLGT